VIRPNSGLILHSLLNTPDRIGLPLHALSSDGTVVKSFGATAPNVRPGQDADSYRVIAPSSDAVWSARINKYTMEKWSAAGVQQLAVSRTVPWFKPWAEQTALPPDVSRPSPRIRGIREDDEGRLWTFVWRAESDWRRGSRVELQRP